MAKILWIFILVFFFASALFAEVNEYLLDPVDLKIGCGDSIVQVNININTIDTVQAFIVGFHPEGTSNPVLDTVLTGGLADTNPPAFAPPSLVSWFTQRIVSPYGPPVDPLLFVAVSFGAPLPPSSGLWCRMFYKVSGTGGLDFVIKSGSIPEPICQMTSPGGEWLPINWPAEGEVGSFNVTQQVNEYSLEPVDLEVSPFDSTIQVNINVNTIEVIDAFMVPLFAEGTSNPVLDTVLTGGLSDANPPAFNPPSLVANWGVRGVMPYGPPVDPMLFWAGFGPPLSPSSGLYCRMFYTVSGPGTLTFKTAVHPTGGTVRMLNSYGEEAPINWPAEGEVGSFNVTRKPNEYLLDPVDLKIGSGDSIVQVNININTVDYVLGFQVNLFPEGTSSPVLDTIMTGGLADSDPPAFAPPSLVSWFTQRVVYPYGPPVNPLMFLAISFNQSLPPSSGLWCRMFYKVSGSGSLTFRTGTSAIPEGTSMTGPGGEWLPINWPTHGEVGSFEVIEIQRGDPTGDGEISVADIIYLIHYMFYNGPSPNPFLSGDANCDDSITISDVVYLINYLFKEGPAPGC